MSRSSVLMAAEDWFEFKARLDSFGFYVDSQMNYTEVKDQMIAHGEVEYRLIDEEEFNNMIGDMIL